MTVDAARSATGDPAPRSAERGANPKGGAPADDPAYDYVTVGHVTIDVLADPPSSEPSTPPADGARQPGGSAFYSALQAARLGLRALIVTSGVPAEIEALLEPYRAELELRVLPAAHTTALRTWSEGATRRQRLLAWAGPIAGPVEVDTAILHLAPVARETPRALFDAHPPRAAFVGLTPQGFVRAWDAHGDIAPAPLRLDLLPERYDAAVLSEHERHSCAQLIPIADRRPPATTAAGGPLLAITAGAQPTAIYLPSGEVLHVPVPVVENPRDDLGAGDVFAAAFFVALHEGRGPADAAAFGNAAAAVRLAGAGPRAIGERHAIEARLSEFAPPAPRR